MNLDNPNLRSFEPSDGPDDLAAGVIDGLARSVGQRRSWTFFGTAARAIVSFGVLPLVELPLRFREFVTIEQQQLWHLTEWLQLHAKHPDISNLRQDAEELKPRSDMPLLAWLATAMVLVIFSSQLRELMLQRGPGGHWFRALLDSTWLFHSNAHSSFIGNTLARKLFTVWSVGLGVGYIAYYRQVRAHERAVRRFIGHFNIVSAAEDLQPIHVEAEHNRIRPVWILGAVGLAVSGAYWGIPMMLAAAAHRAHIMRTSVKARGALALHLMAMVRARHPDVRMKLPVQMRRICRNEICRAPASEHATFCSRCGQRLSPRVHLFA